MATIGAVIRQKRQAQSISIQKLADILKINHSLLCRYETGKRNISKNHAEVIGSYLSGDYDKEILNMLLSDLEQRYEHLVGKKGLDLWV